MSAEEMIARLRELQAEADEIRQKLRIGAPSEVLFLSCLNMVDEDIVVVEADGFGGATTKVVEGNYPLDYMALSEEEFSTQAAALAAAAKLVDEGGIPEVI